MKYRYLETVDSTMLEAERIIASGLDEPVVLIADAQTGGHGRYGRAWQSPPGNLYWTAVVPLDASFPKDASIAPLTALAVVDALTEAGVDGRSLRVKWPNDTLIDDRKVSGVLIKRSYGEVPSGFSSCLIVGIGVNVSIGPENVAFPATCLREALSDPPTPRALGERLARNFERRLEQWKRREFAARREEYESRLFRLNRPIEISFDRDRTDRVGGINRGVDATGALLLELEDGSVRTITVGEVMAF